MLRDGLEMRMAAFAIQAGRASALELRISGAMTPQSVAGISQTSHSKHSDERICDRRGANLTNRQGIEPKP